MSKYCKFLWWVLKLFGADDDASSGVDTTTGLTAAKDIIFSILLPKVQGESVYINWPLALRHLYACPHAMVAKKTPDKIKPNDTFLVIIFSLSIAVHNIG